ncbi:MAG: branched-chain amino acid transaminase [Gemmatimonadales bacterium]|nr:MAG: branched-chain amino acid transaminase [Gemmatimonadales bacterium]
MSGRIGEATWIWKDGELVAWKDATVHLLSTAVQFGSSVFEGIRCYATPRGPAIFRLPEHICRLLDSASIYRMRPDYPVDALVEACRRVVRENDLESCYIRPMVLRGYGAAGLYAVDSPIETWVAAWPWGAYLGAGALEEGVDVCVSSWMRAAPNTFPVAAKAAGHYNAAQLMKAQAVADGYSEAIAVGPGGLVSEGSGQNLFLVRDGVLITPFLDGTSLSGITRDAVLQLAADAGIPVREQHVPRESLYLADELFFTGTASEVTPIRSVDRIPVGTSRGGPGGVGPITRRLQADFMAVVTGEAEDRHGWLTPVG